MSNVSFHKAAAVVLSLIGFCGSNSGSAKNVTIKINHQTGGVVVDELLELEKGDKVAFIINDTNTACYTFNQSTLLRGKDTSTPETVTFQSIYDGRTTEYQITVERKANKTDVDCPLHIRTWTFPVTPLGWTLAFTGALTTDWLSEPRYYLAAGSTDDEFLISRNIGTEDSNNFGFAVMAHLFHPQLVKAKEINWAPISFGIGTTEGASSTRYYLGTSAKFGDVFFLTAGWAFGEIPTLPPRYQLGDTTTDVNALDNLPTRTDSALFLGFSYKLGEVDLSAFKKPFTSQPAP